MPPARRRGDRPGLILPEESPNPGRAAGRSVQPWSAPARWRGQAREGRPRRQLRRSRGVRSLGAYVQYRETSVATANRHRSSQTIEAETLLQSLIRDVRAIRAALSFAVEEGLRSDPLWRTLHACAQQPARVTAGKAGIIAIASCGAPSGARNPFPYGMTAIPSAASFSASNAWNSMRKALLQTNLFPPSRRQPGRWSIAWPTTNACCWAPTAASPRPSTRAVRSRPPRNGCSTTTISSNSRSARSAPTCRPATTASCPS